MLFLCMSGMVIILVVDKQKIIADKYIDELEQLNQAQTKFNQFMDKCQDYLLN